MKEDAWRLLFKYIYLSLYCKLLERVVQGFACERMLETEHKLHILTVTLCLSCSLRCSTRGLGVHSIGAFPRAPSVGCGLPYHIWSLLSGSLLATASGVSEVPLGRVWPSLPHLVSNPLGVCWQLHRGVPRSPSVGCGLPYHISSLTLWESAGNCSGTQTQLS